MSTYGAMQSQSCMPETTTSVRPDVRLQLFTTEYDRRLNTAVVNGVQQSEPVVNDRRPVC